MVRFLRVLNKFPFFYYFRSIADSNYISFGNMAINVERVILTLESRLDTSDTRPELEQAKGISYS